MILRTGHMSLAPSPVDEDESDRRCRICCDKSDGAHFGIDSCRACAAFFRRSVVLGKKYVCRQGGNDCKINKSVRCMCRKCRLKKCLESGMLPESVQSKRDPIVPRRSDPEPLCAKNEPTSSSDSELLRTSNSAFQVVHPSPLVAYPSPTNEVNHKPAHLPHLLDKVINNYKQLCSVRKSTELAMFPGSLRTLFDNSDPLAGMSRVTCTRMSRILRATLPAFSEFVTNTFEEFEEFDQAEKWIVFRSFVAMMMALEGAYRSFKGLPPDQWNKKALCSMTAYFDLEDLDFFMSDVPVSQFNIINVTSQIKKAVQQPHEQLLAIMSRLQIQDEEFAALMALSVFSPNIENSTSSIEEVCTRMRTKIFDQLHVWYRLNNMDNYASRIGELMCLYSCVMQKTCRMKEDLELFNLMDVFSEESFIYDLMKT